MANDYLTSNRLSDELYTGALELSFEKWGYYITVGENIFTDSERDLRFDETYLGFERDLPRRGQWHSSVTVGVVHVGRGPLGQSAQNAVHNLVGEGEVRLPYVDSNRFHPTLAVRFQRPLPDWQNLSFTAHGEIYDAFDFKQHAIVGVRVRVPAFSFASFSAGLGTRYTSTDFDALEPRISRFAPLLEAGVTLPGDLTLSWTYNEFGTKAQHFTVGYEVGRKRGRQWAS